MLILETWYKDMQMLFILPNYMTILALLFMFFMIKTTNFDYFCTQNEK